jgi:DNA polymerase III, epsilon subunit and related 3''-5'' exonucleases
LFPVLIIILNYHDRVTEYLVGTVGQLLVCIFKKKANMSQEYDISSPTIRSFVFLDLETTGLLQREGKNCRIVELCLVAVLREHFLDQCEPFPRVLNKMSLCFNPCRFMDATAMSIHGK